MLSHFVIPQGPENEAYILNIRYSFCGMANILVRASIFSCLKLLTSISFLCLTGFLCLQFFFSLIRPVRVTSKPFSSPHKIFSILLQTTIESFLLSWSLTLNSHTGVSTFPKRLCLFMPQYLCRYSSFCMSKLLRN